MSGAAFALFLTVLPIGVAVLAFRKIAGPAEGRTRKRSYTAWGLSMSLVSGGMPVMKEFVSLFYSLDRISGSSALGIFLGLTLAIAIMSAIGAGIGYALAFAMDKIKGLR